MIKKLCTCLATGMLFVVTVSGQSADSLVAEGRRLEQSMQEAAAIGKYKAAIEEDSLQSGALSRVSILLTREGDRQHNAKAGKSYYLQARDYARAALRAKPDGREANLAMAMALQQLSQAAGAKEKAGYIRDVKTYADKALLIDSAYAAAWHVLGNWNYQVSSLGFAERAATKLLFGSLPAASLDAAVADYQRCRQLAPSFLRNLYDLAGAYHAQGKDLQAIATLNQALRLRPVLQDDHAIQERCRNMIQELQ